LAVELDRNRAITNLKMRILVRENEKKRLQAIIAFSQSPERRKQALDDLADVLKEIKAVGDELAKLEAE
jgi:hypothetical protein